jgi:hypothetical protein
LVGVGRLLRIYDVGKRKMLRKCENKHIPNLIVEIHTLGGRVYVSDAQEAVHFVRYKPVENQLVVFADETYQRYCHLPVLIPQFLYDCASRPMQVHDLFMFAGLQHCGSC